MRIAATLCAGVCMARLFLDEIFPSEVRENETEKMDKKHLHVPDGLDAVQ